jgi:hypothetical protein
MVAIAQHRCTDWVHLRRSAGQGKYVLVICIKIRHNLLQHCAHNDRYCTMLVIGVDTSSLMEVAVRKSPKGKGMPLWKHEFY